MPVYRDSLQMRTHGRGTYDVTNQVNQIVDQSGLRVGVVTVFCQHTSCSLVIMENADPSARHDLHSFLDRLVPPGDPRYTHTLEGPDDATSHIKMALTRTSETIPFYQGHLDLGTWQGIFLWEHRDAPHRRKLIITVLGDSN